jgi:pullulanase
VVAYQKTLAYYRGLIAFRKAHSVLRLTDAQEVHKAVRPIPGTPAHTAAFHLKGQEELFVIFNASEIPQRFPLPHGKWTVCIDGDRAGTDALSTASGSALAKPISALVLVK